MKQPKKPLNFDKIFERAKKYQDWEYGLVTEAQKDEKAKTKYETEKEVLNQIKQQIEYVRYRGGSTLLKVLNRIEIRLDRLEKRRRAELKKVEK